MHGRTRTSIDTSVSTAAHEYPSEYPKHNSHEIPTGGFAQRRRESQYLSTRRHSRSAEELLVDESEQRGYADEEPVELHVLEPLRALLEQLVQLEVRLPHLEPATATAGHSRSQAVAGGYRRSQAAGRRRLPLEVRHPHLVL